MQIPAVMSYCFTRNASSYLLGPSAVFRRYKFPLIGLLFALPFTRPLTAVRDWRIQVDACARELCPAITCHAGDMDRGGLSGTDRGVDVYIRLCPGEKVIGWQWIS